MPPDEVYVGAEIKGTQVGESENLTGVVIDTYPEVVVEWNNGEKRSYTRTVAIKANWTPEPAPPSKWDLEMQEAVKRFKVLGMMMNQYPTQPWYYEHMEKTKVASLVPADQLLYIGFWRYHQDSTGEHYATKGFHLPWPGDFIDPNWDPVERNLVAAYLDLAPDVQFWRGYSFCRLGCEHLDGCTDKSDGRYVWPAGFSHYVRVHNVKPPPGFIQYVRRRGVP
jgi:hypothetical protein